MDAEKQLIDSGIRAWKLNADRVEKLFTPLTDDQLQQEIAPGRNRLIYLWGHLAAVSDGLFPLLGIGPKLRPELDAMYLSNPDRASASVHSRVELKDAWLQIHDALWREFSVWTPADWLAKHTAVSDDDFAREPHRNRFSVMLNRSAHMAFHHGQAVLAQPRT